MGADVVQPFPLFLGIEEPGRPHVRRPRHHLLQEVDALHVDRRFVRPARHDPAERGDVVDEGTLQPMGRFEALRHDVVGDDAAGVGLAERGLELRQVLRPEHPWLVGQHVQARLDRAQDLVDLDAVAPGEDDNVARTVAEHPGETVRTGVHFPGPRCRTRRAVIEAGEAVQVGDQVGADGRENVDAAVHVRIHLAVDERGVEVAGVEGHESDVCHRMRHAGVG